jgi:acyl-CoA thioesterase FadM
LYRETGIGFVVYRAELSFKEGAMFGDELEIRTIVEIKSEYRAVFHQDVVRVGGEAALVEGEVHLVAVDRAHKLVKLPAHVIALAKERFGAADGN